MNVNAEFNPFDQDFDHLEAIADMISEMLQCPVTIEDASHKLLAYSTHHPQTDPARIATIIGRRVPEQVISALWRDGIIQQLMSNNEPIRIEQIPEVGLGNRLAVAIRNQHDILGYIWALEDQNEQPTDDRALLYLKQAAYAAKTKLLQLQSQRRKQEQHSSDYFWQLLTNHLAGEPIIREKAIQLGVHLPQRYQIVVLEFEHDINDKLYRQVHYTLKTAEQLRVALHVTQNNRLILLCSPTLSGAPQSRATGTGVGAARTGANGAGASVGSAGGAASPSGRGQDALALNEQSASYKDSIALLIRQMKHRFNAAPLQRGASTMCDNYAMVAQRYREALAVLQMKQHFPAALEDVFDYPELGLYRYLPAIADMNQQQPQEHPSIMKLRAYDTEHQSDLLHTLEIFLSHDSHVKKAAEALHIHTNTLTYRLKRISEIGAVDLSSMDQKVSIYLELKAHLIAKGSPPL
ncbi:PucR family transcriptional regulator [Paenibacillus sp. 481]|uniref:PucR family transcriptional regulator n=1 Tax=Paenibacillus sp. 481 TaxID=2835869 RepID=UPI001E524EED|nr:helix-turn-helix domain-containing protein [Paenibacillus sp. 481]UHA72693.1 PucR family transcriptional regulator [Paenibacillus sp. 481]